jgi:hypothetical protein
MRSAQVLQPVPALRLKGEKPTVDEELLLAPISYAAVEVSGRRLTELSVFVALGERVSKSVPGMTPSSSKLDDLTKEIEPLVNGLTTREKAAGDALVVAQAGRPGVTDDQKRAAVDAVKDCVNYYQTRVQPKLQSLGEAAANAVNGRLAEAEAAEKSLTVTANRAESFAFWFYIPGTVLALGGQLIEKTKPSPDAGASLDPFPA